MYPASPYIPQLHALLGPLFTDAGLPDGAVQVLHFSEEEVASRVEGMIAHPDVRVSDCLQVVGQVLSIVGMAVELRWADGGLYGVYETG